MQFCTFETPPFLLQNSQSPKMQSVKTAYKRNQNCTSVRMKNCQFPSKSHFCDLWSDGCFLKTFGIKSILRKSCKTTELFRFCKISLKNFFKALKEPSLELQKTLYLIDYTPIPILVPKRQLYLRNKRYW